MTTVYFVRHAQPNRENHDDFSRELSSKGLEDRKRVTAFFQDRNIDLVMSSPFKRAVDTVAHFAEMKGMPVWLVDGFRERQVADGWIEDFDVFCRRQWADFRYRLPGGECLEEVQSRNIAALEKVLREHEGKNIAVGSHGTSMSVIVNYYDKTYGYEDFVKIKLLMPWIVEFRFEGNACMSICKHNLFE